MGKVESILDYIPSEDRLLNCTDCEEPWVEEMPVGAHPKSVQIFCPYCLSEKYVTNYVPKRLR